MNKYFCILPFTGIQLNADGQYRPCCMYKEPLNINSTGVHDVFYSNIMNDIRVDMINNKSNANCEKCYRDEALGKESNRIIMNQTYYNVDIDKPNIIDLEISLGNKCNLKCVTCNSRFSSAWYKEDSIIRPDILKYNNTDKLQSSTSILRNNFDPKEISQYKLKNLKILGGELFLDSRYYDLLSYCNKDCHLSLSTNNTLSVSPKWIDLLKEFLSVKVNISIDGINEVGSFVRYGLNMKRFEKNYKKWLEVNNKFYNINVIPHFVIHSLNLTNIDQTIDWLQSLYKYPSSNYILDLLSYDFLEEPKMLNPSYLPDAYKAYVLNKNVYLKTIISKFLNLNVYNKKITQEFIKYCNFLTAREELPEDCYTLYKMSKQHA